MSKIDPPHRPAVQHFIGRFTSGVLDAMPQARVGFTLFEDEDDGLIVMVGCEYSSLAQRRPHEWRGGVPASVLAETDGKGELDQRIDASVSECLRELRGGKSKRPVVMQ